MTKAETIKKWEREEQCPTCDGHGKVIRHQYLKASKSSMECICGEPMISIQHYDDTTDGWAMSETYKDKGF